MTPQLVVKLRLTKQKRSFIMKTTTLISSAKALVLATAILGSTSLMASGDALYKKCAGCHGAQGEKKALGESKVINTISKSDLVVSLKGYKDGSYGGAMKGLMKGQVASLNDTQIDELATYISTMK